MNYHRLDLKKGRKKRQKSFSRGERRESYRSLYYVASKKEEKTHFICYEIYKIEKPSPAAATAVHIISLRKADSRESLPSLVSLTSFSLKKKKRKKIKESVG
jgi:uncharacterized DUF497 family protein